MVELTLFIDCSEFVVRRPVPIEECTLAPRALSMEYYPTLHVENVYENILIQLLGDVSHILCFIIDSCYDRQ